jgi:protein-tyrosine phosphatase
VIRERSSHRDRAVTRVLFVCMGNICRSPLAEGVFRHLVDERGLTAEFEIDSAGTGAWHAGNPPDPRSREVAERHGVALDGQRARQVVEDDLRVFDWIIAMDDENLDELSRRFPDLQKERVVKLRDFDPDGPGDVPDPYYGGVRGFDDVYEMVDRSCRAFLEACRDGTC